MKRADAQPGVKAGQWTLLAHPKRKGRRWHVAVRCTCGRTATRRLDTLPPTGPNAASSTRCTWCARATNVRDLRTTHPLYHTWRAMLTRCDPDPRGSAPNWRYYGGRGIEVCDRWSCEQDGFWRFVEDVGPRPEGHTLDRIDVNGNYEPGNVRWATASEQYANRRPMSDISPF